MLLSTILPWLAVAAQPVYPADSVLREFLSVCDGQPEDVRLAVDGWKANALEAGWTEIDAPVHPGEDYRWNSDWAIKTHFDGLNAGLAASFAAEAPRIVDARLFRKTVSGRLLFVSTFSLEKSGLEPVIECRLHDPLGDGFRKVPFSREDVERATAADVERSKGYFGETVYRWREGGAGDPRFMEVHFGFEGWPFGPFGRNSRKADPYVSYGMTLVTGWKYQIILV